MANEERFSGLADAYTRGRPDYPADVFAPMIEGLRCPLRAVDVGCGTGISTRQLAIHADTVTGVDPNRDMLNAAKSVTDASLDENPGEARLRTADLYWHCASAEETRLPAGSFGLVLVAQAFHWFDAPRALEEFARLLEPEGRVALLWNLRDDRDSFTRAYSAITVPEAKRNLDATSLAARADTGRPLATSVHFKNYRRLEFEHEQRLDRQGLLDRAGSASYYPRSGPDRAAADAALHALFAASAHADIVTLRYRVELHLAERR